MNNNIINGLIMELKDFNGKEIERFNFDDEKVSFYPDKDCNFYFQHEVYKGKLDFYDIFFIIHIDKTGKEIERWKYFTKSITSIKWVS